MTSTNAIAAPKSIEERDEIGNALADQYWRLRKAGKGEEAAKVWTQHSELFNHPPFLKGDEGEQLAGIVELWDLQYSQITNSYKGFFHSDTGLGLLMALESNNVITATECADVADTLSYTVAGKFDSKGYDISYCEGDISIKEIS